MGPVGFASTLSYTSVLHYRLSAWDRLILDQSPNVLAPPNVFAEAPPSRLPSTKGQSREWHLSEATRPLSFVFRPPASWDSVTFTEGRFFLLRSPGSFWRRNTEGSGAKEGGIIVKEDRWKGWKVEKWGLRIVTKQQRKGRIKRASRVLRSRKDGVINRSRNLRQWSEFSLYHF